MHYSSPYTLLVAVVLSAQATDAGVNKATPALFALADTPQKMVALGLDRVTELIRTIGLFRTKAKNLIALSEKLIADFDGKVPETREALETLPGVGRKTANVVLNVAFGQPTMAVDTHIFRVANRTGIAPGRDPLAVELALEKRVPEPYRHHAHHWLILHGRYTCKARKPDCAACLIADLCAYPAKTRVTRGRRLRTAFAAAIVAPLPALFPSRPEVPWIRQTSTCSASAMPSSTSWRTPRTISWSARDFPRAPCT